MRGNQILGHVGRMAGRIADALEAIDPGQNADQVGEAAAAIRPGIHILAEQDDLASAALDQLTRFGNDVAPRPRDFGAARVGDDAIGAEFVAAFLHRQERARHCPPPRGQARRTC